MDADGEEFDKAAAKMLDSAGDYLAEHVWPGVVTEKKLWLLCKEAAEAKDRAVFLNRLQVLGENIRTYMGTEQATGG